MCATEGGSPINASSGTATRSEKRGEARRQALLDATAQLLEEVGYAGLSTRQVAMRAQASKETLYTHFTDKNGLLEALISREAEAVSRVIREGLAGQVAGASAAPVRPVLEDAGAALLTLLVGPRSIAINRAAISAMPGEPELARILIDRGRNSVGPLIGELLMAAHQRGELVVDAADEAVGVFYGLLIRDSQIQALLGTGPTWTDAAIRRRARDAVAAFYRLCEPRPAR